jgi:hypothetical protein
MVIVTTAYSPPAGLTPRLGDMPNLIHAAQMSIGTNGPDKMLLPAAPSMQTNTSTMWA